MPEIIKAIKGMPDILPAEIGHWQYVEKIIRDLMTRYQYAEIRNPILESTQLFKRSIGDVTDIVEKEMYTFDDRNGDSVSMRPEGTAGCVRACIEHTLLRNQQQQRLWYMGPMYRYERPQKGRYRQFHQLGVESFNFPGADIEAEHLALVARLWQQLGLSNVINLEINSLGDNPSRTKFREKLVKYFKDNFNVLDEDSRRRLDSNPLRILDSKNPDLQDLIGNAPVLLDHIDAASKEHFADLQRHLQALKINFRINNRIVRGLDYYNRTVYEWVSDKIGSQSAVCSGGRFDGLVANLGGPDSTAVGFGIGLERLLLLFTEQTSGAGATSDRTAYLICLGDKAQQQCCIIAEKLRDALPHNIGLITQLSDNSLGKSLQKADKSAADFAIIVGDDELAAGSITVKFLRKDAPQQTIKIEQAGKLLQL